MFGGGAYLINQPALEKRTAQRTDRLKARASRHDTKHILIIRRRGAKRRADRSAPRCVAQVTFVIDTFQDSDNSQSDCSLNGQRFSSLAQLTHVQQGERERAANAIASPRQCQWEGHTCRALVARLRLAGDSSTTYCTVHYIL